MFCNKTRHLNDYRWAQENDFLLIYLKKINPECQLLLPEPMLYS